MVVIAQNECCDGRVASKKFLIFTTTLGITFLIVPVLLFIFEPLVIGAKYYLRVANGSIIHQLMLQKLEGPKIYVNLFNVTNAEEFLSGQDTKLKVQEVGPFVYQEYRINHDLVIDAESSVMKFTPELWAKFVPEESYGDPKQVYVTMPSIPMLTSAGLVSSYSILVQSMFNMLASSVNSKAIVNITAHDYLWGYHEPLIKFANKFVPGMIYYNSSGLLDRLYDGGATYTLEYKTEEKEKFSVISAKKFRVEKNETSGAFEEYFENTQTFNESYEGAIFPPGLSPEKPLKIFRHSVCKVFPFTYRGTTTTEYGSEAFVYDIANSTLNDHELCDGTSWCPDGLLNLGPCYDNFPFAITRGHFLYSDPRIMDKVEGIRPDPKLHSSNMVIDPRLGITVSSSISVQLNIVLGDVSYNTQTRRFKNMVVPISHATLKHPKLPWQADTAFRIIYVYGPYITITTNVLCALLGLGLIMYSVKKYYYNRASKNISSLETNLGGKAYMPLPIR